MKKLLLLAFLFCPLIQAQTSAVTATITDRDGQTWNNGLWRASLYTPNGATPSVNGVALTSAQQNLSGALSSGGVLTGVFADNNYVNPAGSYWMLNICSYTSAPCSTVNSVITGATPNLSASLSAQVLAPRFYSSPSAYGYLDTEIALTPTPGGSYYNVVNQIGRVWTGSAWVNSGGGGGTGTVTHTLGALTANYAVAGNGAADIKSITVMDFGITTANTITMTQALVAPSYSTPTSGVNGSITLSYNGTAATAPASTNQFQITPAIALSTSWTLSPAAAPGSGVLTGVNTAGIVQQGFKSIVGTDAGIASAATISTTAGTAVCSTANGGVTTTGCSSGASYPDITNPSAGIVHVDNVNGTGNTLFNVGYDNNCAACSTTINIGSAYNTNPVANTIVSIHGSSSQSGASSILLVYNEFGTLFGITGTSIFTNSLLSVNSNIKITNAGGVASSATVNMVSIPYTGGTSTTTFPDFYQDATGATAPTTFSVNGTFRSANGISGFTGNITDDYINGVGVWSENYLGMVATLKGAAVASATTIVPTGTVFHVTGTTAIATITPPANCARTGYACQITLIADAAWTTTTAGNIKSAMTAVANALYLFTFDGTSWFIK